MKTQCESTERRLSCSAHDSRVEKAAGAAFGGKIPGGGFAPSGHTEGHPPLDHFGEGLRRMLLTSWHLGAALPDLPVACLQRL